MRKKIVPFRNDVIQSLGLETRRENMARTGILCAAVAVSMAIAACLLQIYHQDTEKPELLLGVCVLSARDHLEQRTAIRNTWLTADDGTAIVRNQNRTVVKFVVGAEACLVHPADRVDQFGCREWTPNIVPDMERDFEAFVAEEEKYDTGPSVIALSVRVLHPVVL